MTGVGINLREVTEDNGDHRLKVLGLILDGPAYSAGVRQVDIDGSIKLLGQCLSRIILCHVFLFQFIVDVTMIISFFLRLAISLLCA